MATASDPTVTQPDDDAPPLSAADVLLPGGRAAFGQAYHSRRTSFDPETKRWRKSPPLPRGAFDESAWRDHLDGKQVVDLPWSGRLVDCAELDIDRSTLDTRSWESVLDRLVLLYRELGYLPGVPAGPAPPDVAIRLDDFDACLQEQARARALLIAKWKASELPGVLWRSSSGRWRDGVWYPGGVRLRLYFDDLYPPELVRKRVAAVLDRAFPSWEQQDSGWKVELWPHGDKVLRLPGGSGSDLIDICGRPLTAREVAVPLKKPRDEIDEEGDVCWSFVRVDLHRDLGAFLAAWAERARHTISLPQKTRVCRPEEEMMKGQPAEPAATGPRPVPRHLLDPAAYIPPPVDLPGTRNDELGRLTCGWYLNNRGRGLSAEESAENTITRARLWLSQPGHASRQLADTNPRKPQNVETALRSIRANLKLVEAKLRDGQLTCGPPRAGQLPAPHLGRLYSSLRSTYPCFLNGRPGWKDAAMSALTDDDHRLLEALGADDKYLVRPKKAPKLKVLVGMLRLLQEIDGVIGTGLSRVKVPWGLLERLAGTRYPKGHPAARDETGFGAPRPYKYLLKQLRQLGYLGEVVQAGREGASATVFAAGPRLR